MSFLGKRVTENMPHVEEILNSGNFEVLFAEEEIVIFKRTLQDRIALVVINTGGNERKVRISLEPEEIFTSSFGLESLVVDKAGGLELMVEPSSVDVFHNQLYNVC